MSKKSKHGGVRKGAGRPSLEPTVLMRVPISLVEKVKTLIAKRKSEWLKNKKL